MNKVYSIKEENCKVLNGSESVAFAVKLAKPGVCAMYPITPSTKIPEKISEFVADGLIPTKIILVESEHSALSALVGAAATGVRTFTATASQGLALMGEVLPIASGMRLPIVLACGNRSLSAPINIWNDHSDAITFRDQGWIQLFVESCQEALDTTLQAFKIAEDENILLPVMINLDGFTLTHVFEPVMIPKQKEVNDFLPELKLEDVLDINNPKSFGPIAFPDSFMEFKEILQKTMMNSFEVIKRVHNDFAEKFGRSYGDGLIELYEMTNADYAVITLGTITGTAREVVNELRKKDLKVGLIKLKCLRPFPEKELLNAIKDLKGLAVVDRHVSIGSHGIVFEEIKAITENKLKVNGYIAGLGGRDVKKEHFKEIFNDLIEEKEFKEKWLK